MWSAHTSTSSQLLRYWMVKWSSPRSLGTRGSKWSTSESIRELAVELTELAERTREGDVKPRDMRGGTFTVTNPGTIGGTAFTPIINWPQVAILGTARARQVPVVGEGTGEVAGSDDAARSEGSSSGRVAAEGPSLSTRLELPIVLGFDHRVNDGADAARFARTVVEVLEDPGRLLLEA